jgi:hypothetical protein
MKRLIAGARRAIASRALPPAVCGIFLLLYVVIAFASDEPLTALIAFTRRTALLAALLALIPLNRAARGWGEVAGFLSRRRALRGGAAQRVEGLFDEGVTLPEQCLRAEHAERLAALGYLTRRTGCSLAGWRGATLLPARLAFLLAGFCLFAGILLSVTTRSSQREAVVEGEPLPSGGGAVVQRIVLKDEPGPLLARSLAIEVASQNGERRSFGLYPPARQEGYFVYPRYLGVAPVIRFAAPDLPAAVEQGFILMIYPPGREDTAQLPGTPYRIVMKMASQQDGDPLVTGRMVLEFRVMKGEQAVFAGSAPIGGEAARDGYRIAFPSFVKVVATDFVEDHGVLLIWSAGVLFALSFLLWLPVRLWLPRQEMLFIAEAGGVRALSRAEGRRRGHAERFHEMLDLIGGRQ